VSERTDTERLNLLADVLHGEKWSDVAPSLRPRDWVDDEPREKYIDRDTFRDALDRYLQRRGTVV
jgi:hypothetical protein